MPMETFTSACPRNCYSTCGLRVRVEGGRLRAVEAHPGNRATSEGPCLKGLSYVERVHSPDRILGPLRRRADRSGFDPLSWEEAIEEIASQLERLRADPGPQGLLYYAASGTKGLLNAAGLAFWRLFGGCTTTYGDLCWPAGLEATRLTLGDNRHNAPWDLAHARLVVLWGKNPAETNVHQMAHLDRALGGGVGGVGGGRLIVVDPRRTETAERAELLIRPRPGTDGALALAVAHLLVREGWIDREFVDRHVLGFPEFAERVGAFPPERAAAICEIPVEQVQQLAGALGRVRPATINTGFGMQRYTNSGQTMRAILALAALTGNIGRKGGGWVFANLETAIFDAVKDPLAFYPPERPDGVVRVGISTARLGRDILAAKDPPIRMIWVERGNPVTQNPESGTVLRAFRAARFRVVIDQFLTDTAREADLVLPAKTMFEQTDVIGAYWHPYLQIRPRILEPPGEVKPETEVYRLLGRRLGIADEEMRAAGIPGPSQAEVEAYLEARLAPFEGLSLERLREGPVLAPGHKDVAFADLRFPTPSGKIEILSREAEERWGVDPLPDYTEPAESIRRAAPDPARYPLHLLTPNTKDSIHSQFQNLRMIRRVSPGPRLSIHPLDARGRGVGEGARVRVHNERGSFEAAAHLDPGLKRGCVSIPNGWWVAMGGGSNACSLGRETDLGHGAAFHENRVQVERAP